MPQVNQRHHCDSCDTVINRHVFCSSKCSKDYYNAHRRDSAPEIPLTISPENEKKSVILVFDSSPCPQHKVFKGTCGCS